MNTFTSTGPSWSTASSFDPSVTTTPLELSELGRHLHHCKQQSGRLTLVRCGMEATGHFMASRLVTTAILIALVGLTSLLVS